MIDRVDNLIDMSLCLNESTPVGQTKQEIPGIERRPRSRREHRLNDEPRYYLMLRRKPQRVYVLRILYAESLDFHYLT